MIIEAFTSNTGLGVHKRSKHARIIHSAGAAEIRASQKKCTSDVRAMATFEVEIISKNPKEFVNKELVKVIENRRSLQTSYKREKRDILPVTLPSGSDARTTARITKPSPYMDMMRFLDQTLVNRRSVEQFEGKLTNLSFVNIYIYIY